MQTEFSLQSGAHFADPIFQKCSKRSVSYSFETQIELSLLSCAHFADLIFQKVLRGWQIFLTSWSANRALATVLRTFCRQLSQIEVDNRGNRDPTSATPGCALPDKTQGFVPGSAFTRSCTRSRLWVSSTATTRERLLLTMLLTWWWWWRWRHYDIMTLWLWHYDIMTLWHYDNMTLWHYDIMTRLRLDIRP